MKLKLTKWAAEANNNCNLISRSGAITNNNNNNCSQVPTSLTTHTKGTWIRHPPAHLALASAAASLHAFKYTEEEKRVGAHLFQWLFKMVKNFFSSTAPLLLHSNGLSWRAIKSSVTNTNSSSSSEDLTLFFFSDSDFFHIFSCTFIASVCKRNFDFFAWEMFKFRGQGVCVCVKRALVITPSRHTSDEADGVWSKFDLLFLLLSSSIQLKKNRRNNEKEVSLLELVVVVVVVVGTERLRNRLPKFCWLKA